MTDRGNRRQEDLEQLSPEELEEEIKRNKKKSKIKTEGVFLWQKLVLSEPEHGGQHLQCC